VSCIKLQPCILENSKEDAVSEKRDNLLRLNKKFHGTAQKEWLFLYKLHPCILKNKVEKTNSEKHTSLLHLGLKMCNITTQYDWIFLYKILHKL